MKNSSKSTRGQIPPQRHSRCFRFGNLGALAALLLLPAWQGPVYAQSDNFDSYSTTTELTAAGWILSSLNPALVTTTFPAVGAGKGLRVQANPIPGTVPAAGMWYRTNVYSDFYVSLDIANWPGTDKNQAMVLFGRMTAASSGTVTGNINPADAQGMICNYDASQYGEGPTSRRQGQFQINRIQTTPAPFTAVTLAVSEITFVPGRSYRLILKGVGTRFTAQAYDMNDLTTPLVTLEAEDGTYASGACGILSFSREDTSGVADATYDNYYAGATDPNPAPAPALAHPIAGTPQVVTRTPAKRFTNFHPINTPISFTARTFTTGQINSSATKLYLNGVDMSSILEPFPANGSTVNFTSALGMLEANQVYAGRIELQDTTGTMKSVNTFWFDTFTEPFLTNAPAKTVELEDYNYDSGKYQLDPIPISGYDTNSVLVNGGGVGYVDLLGSAEIDFHDNRTSGEGGFNDYRAFDPVGTSRGNKDIQDLNRLLADPLPPEAHRQKYAALGLQEYLVARTEPGEWLNYTRAFADTNYLVYLRVGSFGATEARLDLVSGDITTTNQTTTALGTFSIPNNLMHINETYEPLRAPGGSPVVLRLSGTNTLRLTMLGTAGQDNRMPYLNYLLFVPTAQGPTLLDTFSDGNDTANPPWDHYDPLGGLGAPFPAASFLLTNGGYRIYSPAPPVPDAGAARAGSFLRNADYTDFYASVDIIDFDDTVRQVFGIAARISTPGLQTTDGYLFSWEPGGGTLPGTNNGDLDISRLIDEVPVGQIETAPSGLHLERGKSYRFVFMGKGADFEGQVYELPNLSSPLIRLPANDPDNLYPSGRVGLITADQGDGDLNPGDATFDNFLVTTAEPRLAVNWSGGAVVLSWPQIPFRLQSSPSLSSPTWTDVTSGIIQVGNQNSYSVSPTSQSYYRLIYP